MTTLSPEELEAAFVRTVRAMESFEAWADLNLEPEATEHPFGQQDEAKTEAE